MKRKAKGKSVEAWCIKYETVLPWTTAQTENQAWGRMMSYMPDTVEDLKEYGYSAVQVKVSEKRGRNRATMSRFMAG